MGEPSPQIGSNPGHPHVLNAQAQGREAAAPSDPTALPHPSQQKVRAEGTRLGNREKDGLPGKPSLLPGRGVGPPPLVYSRSGPAP